MGEIVLTRGQWSRRGRPGVNARLVLAAVAVGLLSGCLSGAALAREAATWLITEGEAMLAAPPTARGEPDLPRNGPIIRVLSPSGIGAVSSPFIVDVRFEPRAGGASVQVGSLKVTYLRLFEIDITERVRPYVSESGLLIREARVPQGRHRLKIAIADQQGNVTAAILEIIVR